MLKATKNFAYTPDHHTVPCARCPQRVQLSKSTRAGSIPLCRDCRASDPVLAHHWKKK